MIMSSEYPLLGGGVPEAVGMGNPLPAPINNVEPEPEDDGPLTADFIQRLHEQIAFAEKDLEVFREQNKRRTELYAGHGYGTTDSEVDTPYNVYNLALRLYQRRLISGDPKANVRARTPKAKMQAYELSLACDQCFREIKLRDTMKEVVHQAMESVGVVKVAVTPAKMSEAMGFLHDADQPFCDPVLLENFAYDTNAKRWEEIDWCGDRYRIPLEDLQGNDMWNQDAVSVLNTSETRQGEDLRNNPEEESVQRMGVEASVYRNDLRQYVTVWDIWLPREGLLITIPDGMGKPLRVVKWEGPENGPYHLLSFDPIPGNIMPVAPGSHLESVAKLLNRAIRKLGNQLDRQKTNTTITAVAANQGDAKTIQDAEDGDVISVLDPKSTGEVRSGGIDQQSYAFTQGLMSMYSWLAGNLDSLGGLGSSAASATEAELNASGANGLIDELTDKFQSFLTDVMSDLAWYIYSDPQGTRRLIKRIPGTDWEIPVVWGPDRRTRPFFDFEFDVDPYSLRTKSPDDRLKMIFDIIPRVSQLAQAQQLLAQTGTNFDVEALWSVIVRYTGLTELSELIQSNGQPVMAEPKSQTSVGMSVPGIPREYIRRSVSGGGNNSPTQGAGQQALAMMMSQGGGSQQPQASN